MHIILTLYLAYINAAPWALLVQAPLAAASDTIETIFVTDKADTTADQQVSAAGELHFRQSTTVQQGILFQPRVIQGQPYLAVWQTCQTFAWQAAEARRPWLRFES